MTKHPLRPARPGRTHILVSLLVLIAFWLTAPVYATTLPTGFTETTFVSGLSSPTAMQFAPDGRLFIAQQGGALRVVKNGQLLSSPFITLSVNSTGERGLLGIAFDPNFSSNNYIYLYYTINTSPARNRVSRFTANGDIAVANSEVILLDLDNLSSATNHNGGAMHFGSDNMLYIATGENANTSLAQNMNSPYGKMLRINPSAFVAGNPNALFPNDNPFWQTPTGNPQWRNAIWALGFRNPFTFAVQRGTGLMYINDVGSSGSNRREEINQGARGANYGWPSTEGGGGTGITPPIYAYGGSTGAISGCAITGGTFYSSQNPSFPADYVGDYFFTDYCSTWIGRYDIATNTASVFATGIDGSTVDLKVDSSGNLYYLSRSTGSVNRISFSAPPTPTPTHTPTPIPNRAPTPTISAPTNGARYNAGDVISFAGRATDPEDGTLGASRFEWEIVFHHDQHTHPFLSGITGVTSGTFEIPREGHPETTVWYRVYLRVTDSAGLRGETYVDIFPNVVNITVQTSPPGLQITVDGQPRTAPYRFDAVVGNLQTLGAPSPQTSGGTPYGFANWSNGGTQTQQITIPNAAATYTANFSVQGGSMIGTVALAGRAPGTVAMSVALAVTITPDGGSPQATTVNTDNNGSFTLVNLPVGTYNIRIKAPGYLATSSAVTISSGATSVNFGTLRAGDINGDNRVTLTDFSVLARSFNTVGGQPNFDAAADLNGDNRVDLVDFSLLASNFNQVGT
jgi:glucose/arabinose dehydrogenase